MHDWNLIKKPERNILKKIINIISSKNGSIKNMQKYYQSVKGVNFLDSLTSWLFTKLLTLVPLHTSMILEWMSFVPEMFVFIKIIHTAPYFIIWKSLTVNWNGATRIRGHLSPRIVAAMAAPWAGGLEYMGRITCFNWLSTRLATGALRHTWNICTNESEL